MQLNLAEGVDLEAQEVVTGRGCVIGQSGSGKSYLVGVIVEELCRNRLGFVVVDTEGEYHSLKSLFDIVWVGSDKNADIDIDTDFKALFSSCIDNSAPVVLDVSEVVDKARYVYAALEALYAVEESKKKPYLVVIEEADKFTPQIVHPRANVIEEISVRGRKRGIGLLVATQRPANISKNVLAQCSYGFVGKLSIHNDIKAVDTLFADKKDLAKLPELSSGQFLPFGVKRQGMFMAKAREASHIGATPQVRQATGAKGIENVLKAVSKKRDVATAQRTGDMQTADVLAGAFGLDDAKSTAGRLLKKRFGFMGGATEEAEEVSEKYVPLQLCRLRLLTKKKGEYSEHYAILASKGALIGLGKRLARISTGVDKPLRISESERAILIDAFLKGKVTKKALAKDTGFGDADLERTLVALERHGLLMRDKDAFRVKDFRGSLARDRPATQQRAVPKGSIIGKPQTQQGYAKGVLESIFPGSTVVASDTVLMPFYEIRIRGKDRTRVINLDFLRGRPTKPEELAV